MEASSVTPPFHLLPQETQQKIVKEMRGALPEDRLRLDDLRKAATALEAKIASVETFLSYFPTTEPNAKPAVGNETAAKATQNPSQSQDWDDTWTQAAKLKTVFANEPVRGAATVAKGVLKRQPSLVDEKNSEADWIKRLGETLSRMTRDNKEGVKMRAIGSKSDLYYVNLDWFDNGVPKPEYADRLAHLELMPVENKTAPAEAGANQG